LNARQVAAELSGRKRKFILLW